MEKDNQHSQIEPSLISGSISDAAKSTESLLETRITAITDGVTAETTVNENKNKNQNKIEFPSNVPAKEVSQLNKLQSTKNLKFVNSGPSTVFKPKTRMKPTFKITAQVPYPPPTTDFSSITATAKAIINNNNSNTGLEAQPSNQRKTNRRPRIAPNDKSIIIEQRFDFQNNVFANDDQTKQYQFQEQVKRPPGRPRKYPVEINKIKRPQGRPRKNPLPLDLNSSILNHDGIAGKRRAFDLITMSVPPLKKQDTTAVQKADPHPIKFAQAILQSTSVAESNPSNSPESTSTIETSAPC